MNEIERAIKGFENELRGMQNSAPRYMAQKRQDRRTERINTALTVLRAELSRQENAPLTIDEIKALHEASFSGYPVWCRYLNEYSYPFAAVIDRYDGEIVAVHAAGLKDNELNREEDYGKTWLAYRYEPKGEPPCTQD